MIVKTRGIVLRFIKYRETSIIVNIYTEALGLQSYVINGIRSSRSKKNKIALYQPLTMLHLVVYYRDHRQLHRLSEAKCNDPYLSIPLNPKKSAIALFLVEVLGRALKEQTENIELFNFLWHSLEWLDHEAVRFENFHLVFMVKLARYLGFAPHDSGEIFSELKNVADPDFVIGDNKILDVLLACDYLNTPSMTNDQRSNLLNILVCLYRLHVERFPALKSIAVLNQVFR